MVHSYEKGGIHVIDIEILNNVLKTHWVRLYIHYTNSLFFTFPYFPIFSFYLFQSVNDSSYIALYGFVHLCQTCVL